LLDIADNSVDMIWFNGTTRELHIETQAVVEMQHFLPLDFLVFPFEAEQLGFSYAANLSPLINIFLEPLSDDPAIIAFANALTDRFGSKTLDFIVGAAHYFNENFERVNREQGAPYPPPKTLQMLQGSCRDLSVLFMAVLRQMGLAARYVSGYFYHGVEAADHELHAWVEVYVPGGGWVGVDPSAGLLTTSDYIKIASAPRPEMTLPVTGSFRGDGAAQLETDIYIAKQEIT